jgi:capsular exopolysaccharide synthesis family protein
MIEGNININNFEEEGGFDIKSILMKLLFNWKWIIASIIVCLCGAYIHLQKQTPVYRIQATVMINDEQKGSFQNQMQTLQQDFGIMSTTGGLDNELEVLRSKSVIKQAVLDLELYTRYSIDNGFFKPTSTLYGAYPIKVTLNGDDLERLNTAATFTITQPDETSCAISYHRYDKEKGEIVEIKEEIKSLPCTLNTHIGRLVLTKGELPALAPTKELKVTIIPPIVAAKSCLGALSIAPTSKTTSVANISYLDVNKRRGVDFVNQLIIAYNRENNNDKNFVALKTEEFIGRRLEKVAAELDEAEEQMAQYKRSAGLTNLSSDAQRVMQGSSEYEKQHAEIVTQMKLISFLHDYVNNPQNKLQPIPANVGLTDQSLTALIERYNELVVERSNLLRTASESNPTVIEITAIADLMASTIKASIGTLQSSFEIRKKDFERQAKKYDSKLDNAPTQEKILAGYERQLEVKSGLYMMLLQKREENSIALAATADNAKIIDAALANDAPVSPNRRMIWLIALAIGTVFPIAIIYLLELFRYKIEGRNDLEKLTKLPVLGDVPVSNGTKNGTHNIVVSENSNDLMAETFRGIRTNLQFILDSPDKKIIQFTSSTAGEGKTFVSSNLAVSMALLGKKVLLVGLDIRKPRLAEMFDLADRRKGITLFLSGDANNRTGLFEQIMPSGVNENLDILPAGIIPPNPAELLSRKNLDRAMDYLKEVYDYIILDTAPVGLVTDTLIISRVTDATVYICRADYTPKSNMELVNSLCKEGKLKNLSIVLNGIDMSKKKYGYYYGYGKYGKYGRYGYGKYGRYGQYGYGQSTK